MCIRDRSKHAEFTGSPIAKQILGNWNTELAHFVKVMPKAFKEVLAAQNKQLLQAS